LKKLFLKKLLVERNILYQNMTSAKCLFFLSSTLLVGMAASDSASNSVDSAVNGAVMSKGFVDAFFSSFGLILVSEIGDETFIIAALMAMQHPRMTVFAGAFGALVIMTVLSTGLGIVLPSLISRQTVRKFAFVLYTAFGLRLLWIAYNTNPKEGVEEEIKDVEAQLNERQNLRKLKERSGDSPLIDEEDANEKIKKRYGLKQALKSMFENVLDPVFLEALILTFLAEWGDRSQLATIALATHYNAVGVTIGGILGHCICTAGAVTGGKMLAMKISPRPVALFGGITFLACAYYAYAYGESI